MSLATEAELSRYLVPVGAIEGVLDWSDLFGRTCPVELEVGCGKGRFLAERAAQVPDHALLGVDWGSPWLRRAARRLSREEIENVRLLRTDAKHLLPHRVPEASLHRLHIYFPDPWPKKRHHKRRFFDDATTPAVEKVLEPGGQLHVATDYGDYFLVIVEQVARHTGLHRREDLAPAGGHSSNFGVKYLAQGRKIHEAVWEKKP